LCWEVCRNQSKLKGRYVRVERLLAGIPVIARSVKNADLTLPSVVLNSASLSEYY